MCMVYKLVVRAIDCKRGIVGCVEDEDEVDYFRWRISLSTSSELGGDTIPSIVYNHHLHLHLNYRHSSPIHS